MRPAGWLGLLAAALLLGGFLATPALGGPAPKEKLQKIRKQLEQQERELRKTRRKERSVLEELDAMDRRLVAQERELRRITARIRRTNRELARINRSLASLDRKIRSRRDQLRMRVRALYKTGRAAAVGFLLSSQDPASLLRRVTYLERIARQDRELIQTYQEDFRRREDKRRALEAKKAELLALKRQEEDQRVRIARERAKKVAFLDDLRSRRQRVERLLKELKQAARRLERLITRIPKRRQVIPYRGPSILAHKGRLVWPAPGKVVGRYGRHRDPQLGTVLFRKGIEIASPRGAAVRAVFHGVVIYADWFQGYGQMVILNHGRGYYSLYAHLGDILVAVGEKVKRGQIIGRVGDTGSHRGPGLYFEIRHRTKAENPLAWLKRRR